MIHHCYVYTDLSNKLTLSSSSAGLERPACASDIIVLRSSTLGGGNITSECSLACGVIRPPAHAQRKAVRAGFCTNIHYTNLPFYSQLPVKSRWLWERKRERNKFCSGCFLNNDLKLHKNNKFFRQTVLFTFIFSHSLQMKNKFHFPLDS